MTAIDNPNKKVPRPDRGVGVRGLGGAYGVKYPDREFFNKLGGGMKRITLRRFNQMVNKHDKDGVPAYKVYGDGTISRRINDEWVPVSVFWRGEKVCVERGG